MRVKADFKMKKSILVFGIILTVITMGLALPGSGTDLDPYQVTECMNITETGIYEIVNDINGTQNEESYCIRIFSDDVELRANGSTLEAEYGEEESPGDAVYSLNTENVSIKDLVIKGYNNGIYLDAVDGANISGNTLTHNQDWGMYLSRVSGTEVIGNEISNNNRDGIFLRDGSNNLFEDNDFSSNDGHGLYLFSSFGDTIRDNSFSNNDRSAVFLRETESSILTNNSMTGNGVILGGIRSQADAAFIAGGSLEHWNTHEIDTSNTVNGKPVYYWKNQVGGTVPEGAGQVILANSTGVTVENQELSQNTIGLSLGFSNNNNIKNVTISGNNQRGAVLYSSSENEVKESTFSSNSDVGLLIWMNSENNIVYNNSFSNNVRSAIEIYSSINSTIRENEMDGSGVYIGFRGNDILPHWNTHEIDTSNTVNGKPVYYWKNQVGGTVPEGAGQVILANCTDVIIQNQEINSASAAITTAYSERILVKNNTVSENRWHGIGALRGSQNINITRNTASNNNRALVTFNTAGGSSFTHNTINQNAVSMYLTGGSNYVFNNSVFGGTLGLYIPSPNNEVLSNYVNDVDREGIKVYGSWSNIENEFIDNVVINSGGNGVVLETRKNTMVNNTILDSGGNGVHISKRNNLLIDNKVFNSSEWDFYSESTSTQNSIENLTIGSQQNQTKISFEPVRIALRTASPDPELDLPSENHRDIGHYLELTNTSNLSSSINLRVHYQEEEIGEIRQDTLAMWRYNGEWNKLEESGVNTEQKYVYSGQVTEFSTFAPLGAFEPFFQVEILETNSPVAEQDTLQVTANITNIGDLQGTQNITLEINGTEESNYPDLILNEGESQVVTLNWTTEEGNAGNYQARVSSENDHDTEEVVVMGPGPFFQVEILETNSPVEETEMLSVEINVTNIGDSQGTQNITLKADGTQVDLSSITLDSDESEQITLQWDTTGVNPGVYTLNVSSEDDHDTYNVEVLEKAVVVTPITPASGITGISLTALLLASIGIYYYFQNTKKEERAKSL